MTDDPYPSLKLVVNVATRLLISLLTVTVPVLSIVGDRLDMEQLHQR